MDFPSTDEIELFVDDWINLVHAARTPKEQHERLREAFNLIEDCLSEKNFTMLDIIIEKINQEYTSTLLITAILRGTFRAKRVLKNWAPFRDKAIDTIKSRGEDPNILVGLLDK